MIRICLLVCMSLLTLMSGSQAKAAERPYGMAGCGVGNMILGPKGGKIKQFTVAYTNGVFSQTLAISSGSSGCKPDEKTAQLMRQEHFVVSNLGTLSKDMAQGEGDSLVALSETFGCPADIQEDFNAALKSDYANVFSAPGAIAVLDQTRVALLRDPETSANCQYLVL